MHKFLKKNNQKFKKELVFEFSLDFEEKKFFIDKHLIKNDDIENYIFIIEKDTHVSINYENN